MRSGVYQAFWIFLLGLAASLSSSAQPILPGLDARLEKGDVALAWTCQYNSVASIVVGRSADSTGIFPSIGVLSKPKKGVLGFTDSHPLPGQSYYRLQVIFASGLKWSSDCISVSLPPAKPTLPSAIVPSIVASQVAVRKPEVINEWKVPSKSMLESAYVPVAPLTFGAAKPKQSTSLKLRVDSGVKKQPIKYLDPTPDSAVIEDVFIQSKYFRTDPTTKNIAISLPLDVKTAHYALRIYDAGNKLVLQIPHLDEPDIIMDRRNFRKNGVYLFVLKKDGLELERANLSIE